MATRFSWSSVRSSSRRSVAFAALVVAAATAWAGDESLSAAMDAFKAGEFAKAAELAQAVPAEDPARLKAAYLAGEADLVLAKWDDATTAFQEVLDKKATSLPALVGLGRAQSGKGADDAAVATLEKAVKLDPKDVAARRSLGEARFAKGDLDKARSDAEAAVKLDPKDPLSSRSLVAIHIKAEKIDWAEKEADRLVKAIPESPMGHFLRGWVLDRQGKDKDAIEAYEKALAKDDKFIDAHKNLAILCVAKNLGYTDKERTKKAMEHFARYFDLGGKDDALKEQYMRIKGFVEQNGGK